MALFGKRARHVGLHAALRMCSCLKCYAEVVSHQTQVGHTVTVKISVVIRVDRWPTASLTLPIPTSCLGTAKDPETLGVCWAGKPQEHEDYISNNQDKGWKGCQVLALMFANILHTGEFVA